MLSEIANILRLGIKNKLVYFVLLSTFRIFVGRKWSIKPSLAGKMVDILKFAADKDQITTEAIVSHFGFNPTTAKRYLRQLTEFGYLEAHGGNKNKTYSKSKTKKK